MRFAYALGLHVRNEDKKATALKKENLVRIWWGVCSLERVLTAIAGRPSAIHDEYCSVRLPTPVALEEMDENSMQSILDERGNWPTLHDSMDVRSSSFKPSASGFSHPARPSDEPTNSGTYLKSNVIIGRIMHKAITHLYAATTTIKRWEDVQKLIVQLIEEVEDWASSLPSGLNFSQRSQASAHLRESELARASQCRQVTGSRQKTNNMQ